MATPFKKGLRRQFLTTTTQFYALMDAGYSVFGMAVAQPYGNMDNMVPRFSSSILLPNLNLARVYSTIHNRY